MAANRKIGGLAVATALGVLVLLLLFQGGIEEVLRPERAPEDRLPDGPGPVPGLVPNDLPAADAPESTKAEVVAYSAQPSGEESERRQVPLEIAVIDGETGEALAGARPHYRKDGKKWLALQPSGGVYVHPEATDDAGLSATVTVRIDLPDGYALETPGAQVVAGLITIYTERARATFAAWRHADVQVRVTDFEGNPVAGALITAAVLAGRGRKFTADPTNADGWTTVRGIPAIHGERVSVTAHTDLRHASAKGWVVDSWTPARMTVVLPKDPNNHLIGIGGGAGGAFSGRGDRRRRPPTGKETVIVEVFHRDGRPAVGTMVVAAGSGISRHGRTDANGRVALADFVPGKVSVRVTEAGYVMGKTEWVDVVAGRPSSVVIREAPQRWVTGVVLDEDGRGLPSARVILKAARSGRLVCLDQGLQHLNVLTGPDGRFAFPNVPPEKITVRAEYGTRKGEAKAGEAGPVTVKFRH